MPLPLPQPLFLLFSPSLLPSPISALTPPLSLALAYAFRLSQKMYSKFGISAMTCFRSLALASALVCPPHYCIPVCSALCPASSCVTYKSLPLKGSSDYKRSDLASATTSSLIFPPHGSPTQYHYARRDPAISTRLRIGAVCCDHILHGHDAL